MADEDDKGKSKRPTAADAPPKLGRRDLLMGLSTVPALGLFGYAAYLGAATVVLYVMRRKR